MDCRGIFAKLAAIVAALLLVASPATAQFSDSYNFLKAVRDKDGDKVTQFVQGAAGSTLINTKDYTSGDGALHIVVKRRDDLWLRFLLGKGANPNIRDRTGNTPLILASRLGFSEGIDALVSFKADVNLANDNGETPLIIAVQARDLTCVRLLLASGADPSRSDHVAGLSARDYAARDNRSAAVLRAIDEAAKAPAAPKRILSGPGL